MNLTLVFPMAAMVLLTFVVALWMLYQRLQAVRGGHIKMDYFKLVRGEDPPPRSMLQADNHFRNLFEVPVLFYAGCLVAMMIPLFGTLVQIWAWLFVAARILHALMHLGSNRILYRSRAYFLSWFAVLGLWGLIVIRVAGMMLSTP